jgi:Holliday junction DNA helicase RuvA
MLNSDLVKKRFLQRWGKILIFAGMIAFLEGVFAYKSPALVHVDVGGVGYELQISLNTYSRIEHLDRGRLLTHLHIREDAHVLYGFFDRTEKDLFLQLISVSGVGATTARMMLSSMPPEDIVRAIQQGNTRQLESIKGIGKKSAERIILELRDKVVKIRSETPNISSLTSNTLEQDAFNALVTLGIARPAAENAIRKVLHEGPGTDKIEDIIKKALKIL